MMMENGSYATCVNHPSQNFTGFCSFCLAERLQNVRGVERSSTNSFSHPTEDREEPHQVSDKKPPDVRVRRTLLSLFRLDDENKGVQGRDENGRSDHMLIELSNGCDARDSEIEPVAKSPKHANGAKGIHDGLNYDKRSLVSESEVDHETKVSSSSSVLDNQSVNCCIVKRDEKMKSKDVSSWLGSVITRKVLNWRKSTSFRKNSLNERSRSCHIEEKHSEVKSKYRHSCDWNLSNDSDKTSWEDPRHSWDGSSIIGRAFICSFACLDESGDENMGSPSEAIGVSSSFSQRIKTGVVEGGRRTDANPGPASSDATTLSNISGADIEHLPWSCSANANKPPGDRFLEETHQDASIPSVSRRISHRWNKVWNWSINSPFRDFSQKKEHALERSLSESWREFHQTKRKGSMESDVGLHNCVNGGIVSRANVVSSRSRNYKSGDIQNLRLDFQRNKREHQFGRSHSVHYPSPGNVEIGLLRFYLTPLRSSRRNSQRTRARTSRSLARDDNEWIEYDGEDDLLDEDMQLGQEDQILTEMKLRGEE